MCFWFKRKLDDLKSIYYFSGRHTHTHIHRPKGQCEKSCFWWAVKEGRAAGQSINPQLLFMYDACALGYLVTLFSISNRRSRASCRDRAARSREARVEPRVKAEASNAPGLGGEQKKTKTTKMNNNSNNNNDANNNRINNRGEIQWGGRGVRMVSSVIASQEGHSRKT